PASVGRSRGSRLVIDLGWPPASAASSRERVPGFSRGSAGSPPATSLGVPLASRFPLGMVPHLAEEPAPVEPAPGETQDQRARRVEDIPAGHGAPVAQSMTSGGHW